jgi:hypothetical protein
MKSPSFVNKEIIFFEKKIHNNRNAITTEAITLIYRLKAITVRSDYGSP